MDAFPWFIVWFLVASLLNTIGLFGLMVWFMVAAVSLLIQWASAQL